MITEVTKRLITVDEYYKMAEVGILKPTDRVELINGDIYEMRPIGSKHASVVNKLARTLNELFKKEAIIGVQSPISIDSNNEPEPDISILTYKDDYYAAGHPCPSDIHAIIEVSDSSISHDRSVKAPLYAASKIPIYWIIDIEKNQIEEYTKPNGTKYRIATYYKNSDKIQIMNKLLKVDDVL